MNACTAPQTVAQALAQTVAAHPDRTAYIDQGRSYSWQQVDVMAPAHYVAAMGVLGMAMGFWPLACKGWQAKKA